MTANSTNHRAFWANARSGRDDRLVRRFQTGGRLHVHMRLGGQGTAHNRPVVAEVADISMTGLLVRVAGSLRVRAGAVVTLGDDYSTALCRVAHAKAPLGARVQNLGLEILEQSPEFRNELRLAVGALRKDKGQVLEAWEREN